MLLKGFEKKSGEFNGKPWVNYYLHVQKEQGEISGVVCDIHKVKVEVFQEFLKKNNLDLSNCLNRNIELNYNQFGQVKNIEMVK